MIPTLHPLSKESVRWHATPDGDEAEMTGEEALALESMPAPRPDALWWEIRNYSSAMYMSKRTLDALRYAERALAMNRTVSTLHNMAVILEALGRFENAIDYAWEAVRVDPTDDRATGLLGESLLRLGHFSEGWPHYIRNRASFEWIPEWTKFLGTPLPEWEGPHQPVRGKRILVIEGGGYGDNIYFFRWLHTLRHWGADVHYVCQPSFAPLARRQGFRAIENWQGNADIVWSRYDYFCPLLALGGKLGITLENYRWTGPYLRGKFRFPWPTRRVGLCYRAGEATSQRKTRSLNDEQVRWLMRALPRNHTWVNLTRGVDHLPITYVPLDDWKQTADAMSQLDLVVSVDTGIAHLAGAMGIPCYVLLPAQAAWQYPLYYERHPLYPSMTIFRSNAEGISDAVGRAAEQLCHT